MSPKNDGPQGKRANMCYNERVWKVPQTHPVTPKGEQQ